MIPILLAILWLADVRSCACDVAKPETLEARECSLCKVAEQQPAGTTVFFLKDANPTKPNRLLALPRNHYPGPHSLGEMSPAARTELWTVAIEKAKSVWGEDWGIAYNGEERRTQCHGHLHLGKLNADAETQNFTVVGTPAEIPLPEGGAGLWIHPVAGKLHVHSGEQVNEFVLMR
ncbi:MAG: hypothetical protein M3Z09_15905 [Acidobacteriota bacterium]|nr:hypothetical protein [Acidobacteriota bacterium]